MELEAYGHSKISIHALREEGDRATTSPRSNHGISIHALREEGDPFSRRTPGNNTRFLSTPSARRATRGLSGTIRMTIFLSTPSARRAT